MGAGGMANSIDPVQTAPYRSGSPLFAQTCLSQYLEFYGMLSSSFEDAVCLKFVRLSSSFEDAVCLSRSKHPQ